MSKGLKALLKQNRERKAYVKVNGNSEGFNEVPLVKPQPKPKKLNTSNGEADQCFIIIPDVHSYQRDAKAFDLMMDALPILNRDYNVTKFVQLGDLLECGAISSHPPTHAYERIPDYSEEVQWAIDDFWKPAMEALPNANFYALMGNHEDRLNKWLARNIGRNELATQIYKEYLPTDLYEEMGIHVTPYGRESVTEGILEIFPGLICLHGWSHAMNAAKTHLDHVAGGYSIIFGHIHRIQSFVKRNPITNKNMSAWSFGALAKNNMLWNNGKPTNHALGFGIVFTHGNDFKVQTLEIQIDGDKRKLFLPNGQVLSK
jgi:hypothetical protein